MLFTMEQATQAITKWSESFLWVVTTTGLITITAGITMYTLLYYFYNKDEYDADIDRREIKRFRLEVTSFVMLVSLIISFLFLFRYVFK